jgi:hypothetical protein
VSQMDLQRWWWVPNPSTGALHGGEVGHDTGCRYVAEKREVQ